LSQSVTRTVLPAANAGTLMSEPTEAQARVNQSRRVDVMTFTSGKSVASLSRQGTVARRRTPLLAHPQRTVSPQAALARGEAQAHAL
jgi:hypothetical protein